MNKLRILTCVAVVSFASSVFFAVPAYPDALPSPRDFVDVASRTALSFVHIPTGLRVGTANKNAPRPGLSTVKLYMADHVMRHGDGSAHDRDLSARMIQTSDDDAASQLDSKYPGAIDAAAAEYNLGATRRGGFWGSSYTSTADTVTFLALKKTGDPASPILGWMNTSSPVAADGTVQGWGTGELVGATGTKWGWADDGSGVVASASIGEQFVVAADTFGSATDQTDDVLAALGLVDLAGPPASVTPAPALRRC